MWDLFNYIYEIDEFEKAEKTRDFYEYSEYNYMYNG